MYLYCTNLIYTTVAYQVDGGWRVAGCVHWRGNVPADLELQREVLLVGVVVVCEGVVSGVPERLIPHVALATAVREGLSSCTHVLAYTHTHTHTSQGAII